MMGIPPYAKMSYGRNRNRAFLPETFILRNL